MVCRMVSYKINTYCNITPFALSIIKVRSWAALLVFLQK